MSYSPSGAPRMKIALRMQIAIPAGIFLAEIIAMGLILLFDGPYWRMAFIDAAIATLLAFPLVYLLAYRPLSRQIAERETAEAALQERYSELLAEIAGRKQRESVLQARLRLMQYAVTHTLDELLQAIVDEIETLTGSQIGFLHFLEPDQKTLWLQAWSTNTLRNMCQAEGKGLHYSVDQAGVWADCVHERRLVIHNDYASLPHRKGTPEGHAPVIRELVVPILRNDLVVAILGVGNKPQDYTPSDAELVSVLSDFAWDIVEHKQTEQAIRSSEQKFRTLVDWTYDWEKWIDPHGLIVYTSPSCERITGHSPQEFIDDPGLLQRIVHPDDLSIHINHLHDVHEKLTGTIPGVINVEYRILATDGSEHWIDHICRPLFGADGRYLGRRVSSRDITERKQAEEAIRQRNQELERLYRAESYARQTAEMLRLASLALTQTLSLHTITHTLLEYIARFVPCDRASVILFADEDLPKVWAVSGYDGLPAPQQALAEYFHPQSNPAIQALIAARQSILIPDASAEPGWVFHPEMEKALSWLGVPLLARDHVIGLCELNKAAAGFFTQEHVQWIEALANQTSVVIENAWLFEQVRAGRQRLRSLSQRLVEIQENERRYIARELHDEAGQMLTSLIIGLELLEREAHHPDAIVAGVAELNRIVDNVLDELHHLAVDLRPISLDHLGLIPALRHHVETLSEKHKLMFSFEVIGFDGRLPVEIESSLYRIVQEALTNVIRHAHASRVDLLLEERSDRIIVIVEDNGAGFDPIAVNQADKLGLVGMRERVEMLGGDLTIDSAAGNGTVVSVEVPYVDPNPGG